MPHLSDTNNYSSHEPTGEHDTVSNDRLEAQDTPYTELDEVGYTSLDEENDREVSSRGGEANYTQNVDADPESARDDAVIREGELPVQDEDLTTQ